jgi:hypothetical protein
MSGTRRRGSKPFGHVQAPVPHEPSAKEVHHAEVPGRAEQGMGSGGKPGGTKSAGGKGGRVQGGMRGGDRGGWKSGGGRPSEVKPPPHGYGGRAP